MLLKTCLFSCSLVYKAYFLKNPGNFVPLIFVNGAESLKKKHTIVISVSSTLHLAHKKSLDFFICNPHQTSFITPIT